MSAGLHIRAGNSGSLAGPGRRLAPAGSAAPQRLGLEALAWYHERTDEHRSVGLGPLHDWSSHAADAFGLLAIAYEEPAAGRRQPIYYPKVGYA
jgi:phage terminase large subunit